MSQRNRRNKQKNKKNSGNLLLKAIEEGQLEIVQNIVDNQSLDSSPLWLGGYAPLCVAIRCNRVQIITLLLSKDCIVNRINEKDVSDTPLHMAVCNDNSILVKLLLDKGACVNIKNCRGETPLHISCQKGNFEISKLLLETDSTIADLTDTFFNTALHFAVEKECLEIVELLLSYKADINAYTVGTCYKGCTPLHISIMKQHQEMVKLLLENGADIEAIIKISHINSVKSKKSSYIKYKSFAPLHLAVAIDNYLITELLIDHKANVNAVVQDNGMTPLHIAVGNKNQRIVILLSQCNSNFKAKTIDGRNILHLAIENDWFELVDVLICKGADVNEMTNTGDTPLHIAVEMGDEDLVELLLTYDVNINIANFKCKTPLHVAAEFSAEIVDILLSRGAEIDVLNCDKETPLYIAVKYSQIEVIEELLKYKPSIQNNRNKAAFLFAIKGSDYVDIIKLLWEYGFTITLSDVQNDIKLLYNAVKEGYIQIVENILKSGLDICTKAEYQFLLHKAVSTQNHEMAELLIKFNCSLNSVDDHGRIPIGYAVNNEDYGMLYLLLKSGAEVKNIVYPVLCAAKIKNAYLLRLLLQVGANVNVSDEYGTTSLHFAAWYGNYNLVMHLLNLKAHVNTLEMYKSVVSFNKSKDNDSYKAKLRKELLTSPLHVAVTRQHIEVFTLLLEHYANVNAKDGHNRTPLHIASSIKSHNQEDVIQILLSYGADINAVDDSNKVPLYYVYNLTCVCNQAMSNHYNLYCECDCYTCNDSNDKNITAVFVKHMSLLIAMNKNVNKQNLEILSNSSLSNFSEKLQIDCLLEITQMKVTKITTGVTYFDILVKGANVLAAYAPNKEVQEVVESGTYEFYYPLYSKLLKRQFDNIFDRKQEIDSAYLSFKTFFTFHMPHVIIDHIFKFLNSTDLNNISVINRKRSNDTDTDSTIPMKKFKST